jgi:hypothetical protein
LFIFLKSYPQAFSRRPTQDVDRAAFWRTEVVRILRRMLELASYPSEMRDHYVRVYDQSVIPHLGPTPDEFGTVYKPCSIMLDDHGPSELGWAVDSSEKMTVRFYAEPLCAVDGSPASRDEWMPILDKFIRTGGQTDPHLGWTQACIETLTCEPSTRAAEAVGSGTSQFILGRPFPFRRFFFHPSHRPFQAPISRSPVWWARPISGRPSARA